VLLAQDEKQVRWRVQVIAHGACILNFSSRVSKLFPLVLASYKTHRTGNCIFFGERESRARKEPYNKINDDAGSLNTFSALLEFI
jgi:hypothetical protein